MNISKNTLQYRTISASGTTTLVGTIVSSVIAIAIWLNLPWYIPFKIIGIIVLYAIIGLIADDLRGLDDLMKSVYDITVTKSDLSAQEKQTFIVSQVEAAIDQWLSLWILFEKIVKEEESLKTNTDLLLALLKKLPKGELNIYQALYIYAYFVYSIIFFVSDLTLNPIYDALIIVGVLILLLLSSGKMIGMSKFFIKVFKTLIPTSEEQIVHQLELLRQFIVQGNHVYYYLDLQKET